MTGLERVRGWFTETRASDTDYTAVALAAIQASARGFDGVRSTGSYQAALNLIEKSASVAEVEGEFSESLRPHIGSIARSLVDRGEATYELQVAATGELMLLPATIINVTGSPDPASWTYSLNRAGPSETMVISQPAAAVLAFQAHVDPKRPWRGRPALEASGTGQLLADLEKQMASEARFTPARLVSGTMVKDQRKEIKDTIAVGGIVTISGGKSGGNDSTKALEVGTLKGEYTQGGVALHEGISRIVSGALGVPPDLLGSSASEAGTRESFRRFAASTINPLLEIIRIEFQAKIGPLSIEMEALRAGDIAARSRAVGSRSVAFKNFVANGIEVERALVLAGIEG